MTNKCDVLTEARNQVAKNGRVTKRYFNGECYCAVGYVLKVLGLTDDELTSLGNSQIWNVCDRGKYHPDASELHTKVYQSMSEAGITVGWLDNLQRVNDNNENTDGDVVAAFDKILEKANC